MIVGQLTEIWQYPLKSAAGITLPQAMITQAGIAGDRCWAVLDAELNEIRSAKRWPELLNLSATLATQPDGQTPVYDDAVPTATVTLPNGDTFDTRDPNADQKLSDFLGWPAKLAPLAPPTNSAHYKMAKARSEEDIVSEMGLLEGEDFPDFSNTPAELMQQLAEHMTPPGTYFDAFPLHLISTQSLDYLSQRGGVNTALPRFRANLLVRASDDAEALPENSWVGKRLQIGSAIVAVNGKTVRCSMPSRAQSPHGLHVEKGMARAMVDHVDRYLGINLVIEQAGQCQAGDDVILLD
jgi:uncharacterized protein YcbX